MRVVLNMNAERRRRLTSLSETLSGIKNEIEFLRDEEQDYIDNMPVNLQGSERYETASEALDAMDSACNSVEEAIYYLENATGEW